MGIFHKIINILFPSNCIICGKGTDRCELCSACNERFIKETFLHCGACSKPASRCRCGADFLDHTKTKIGDRGFVTLTFYKSRSTESDNRITERMLYILKDKGLFAEFFASLLADELRNLFKKENIDPTEWIVTYPPRSKKKFNEKGFDQSEEIACRLAKKIGANFEKTFVRKDSGEVQKNLRAAERFANAEESIIPLRNKIRPGGKYIIFDDIITTGATVETMAKHLYFAGAESVFPVAVCRTLTDCK